MLHHHVMLTLVDGSTDAEAQAIIAGLVALPGEIPGLESIEVRSDEGLAEGNAQIMFHMIFTDEQSWRGYTPHSAHKTLAAEHILPILKTKTALQYLD